MIPWQFLVFSPLWDYPLKRNTKKVGSQFQVGLLKSDSKVSNLVRVPASAGFTVSAFPLASAEPDAPFPHPPGSIPSREKTSPLGRPYQRPSGFPSSACILACRSETSRRRLSKASSERTPRFNSEYGGNSPRSSASKSLSHRPDSWYSVSREIRHRTAS